MVHVVDYEPRHRHAFRTLNLEWIEQYFVLEDIDRKMLDDPEETILRDGGCIFIAEEGGEYVGTCALIRMDDGIFELAKMAVAPAAHGKGIGTMLGQAAVDRARSLGATRVELLSNSKLGPALHVYRKLGFVNAPLGPSEYQRADVKMVLELPVRSA